jgi:hypothetical protein
MLIDAIAIALLAPQEYVQLREYWEWSEVMHSHYISGKYLRWTETLLNFDQHLNLHSSVNQYTCNSGSEMPEQVP